MKLTKLEQGYSCRQRFKHCDIDRVNFYNLRGEFIVPA
ncbi:Putative uncharacterized protein [Moritella viscosa]|uniref:Uncharacterized protein n=1 Tax=Moritella viscosa TaxID=80854 RepID=A0ABY1H7V8_9GAMM|nr:Putative uncharacterized protein [Moritella viscosa]SGZ17088.1 Putative uncharacterized protein [Moritella viscosa]SHO28184.1 Putative uncharacterized protein [Moritella viscosa]